MEGLKDLGLIVKDCVLVLEGLTKFKEYEQTYGVRIHFIKEIWIINSIEPLNLD